MYAVSVWVQSIFMSNVPIEPGAIISLFVYVFSLNVGIMILLKFELLVISKLLSLIFHLEIDISAIVFALVAHLA